MTHEGSFDLETGDSGRTRVSHCLWARFGILLIYPLTRVLSFLAIFAVLCRVFYFVWVSLASFAPAQSCSLLQSDAYCSTLFIVLMLTIVLGLLWYHSPPNREVRLTIGDLRSCGNIAPSSRGRVVNGLSAKACQT